MKLILIYGPPAAGKFTTAKALAKITDFKIFHNHDINDVVEKFFPWESPQFGMLAEKFRMDIISAAAKANGPNLIMTFCYVKSLDDQFIRKIIREVKKYHGHVHFVHLYCQTTELFKRVKHPSREEFGKVKTVKNLKHILKSSEFFTPIPFVDSLLIDNTNISAKETARKIKSHFKL